MQVSVIILSYNTKEILKNCLESIFNKKWENQFEFWVVDNASSDGSAEMVAKDFPKVNLIKSDKNLGYTGGNNIALKKISSEIVILLNSDTLVLEHSLDELVHLLADGNYAVGSCKLLNYDKTLQPNAGNLPFGISLLTWLSGLDDIPFLGADLPSFHRNSEIYYRGEKEVGWVSGSVIAIRQEVFKSIGYLDEGIFMYGEDVDFCIRSKKAGFRVGWTDKATIVHFGGGSSIDPRYKQWLGEFKGLLYIYQKYYGLSASLIIRFFLYLFIILRIVGFLIVGKFNYSKTYAKILLII